MPTIILLCFPIGIFLIYFVDAGITSIDHAWNRYELKETIFGVLDQDEDIAHALKLLIIYILNRDCGKNHVGISFLLHETHIMGIELLEKQPELGLEVDRHILPN